MLALGLMGFLIGLTIPAISGRFGKILPADPGQILLQLWHTPHFPKPDDVIRSRLLYAKWKKMLFFSLGWGTVLSALFISSRFLLPADLCPWGCLLSVLLAFCIVVDRMYCLIPDFFTIPLLFLGFGMATFVSEIAPVDSFAGACFGYAISTLSVLVLGLFSQAELGGGDVKMMTAMGAWLGVWGIDYALFLSFFLFVIQAICSGRKVGPFGPALGTACMIVFFLIYAN